MAEHAQLKHTMCVGHKHNVGLTQRTLWAQPIRPAVSSGYRRPRPGLRRSQTPSHGLSLRRTCYASPPSPPPVPGCRAGRPQSVSLSARHSQFPVQVPSSSRIPDPVQDHACQSAVCCALKCWAHTLYMGLRLRRARAEVARRRGPQLPPVQASRLAITAFCDNGVKNPPAEEVSLNLLFSM
jgi:hypothetical protein